MKTNKFNIAIKLSMLALAAIAVFTSCSKDETEPEDPKATEIANLEAQKSTLTPKVRKSIADAKVGIEGYIILKYNYHANIDGAPKNLLDSAYIFRKVADDGWIEYGKPLPINEQEMTTMYNTCGDFIDVNIELQQLYSR